MDLSKLSCKNEFLGTENESLTHRLDMAEAKIKHLNSELENPRFGAVSADENEPSVPVNASKRGKVKSKVSAEAVTANLPLRSARIKTRNT